MEDFQEMPQRFFTQSWRSPWSW